MAQDDSFIISFNDSAAPTPKEGEKPFDANRRHVREKLNLQDSDIQSIVWCDNFGGGEISYEFVVTAAAAQKLKSEQPAEKIRAVALGSEPSFRFAKAFKDDLDW